MSSLKKIGIITFHYANNYGAVLQTYALKHVIDMFNGCASKVINFVPRDKFYYYFNDEQKKYLMHQRPLFEKFLMEECDIHDEMGRFIPDGEYDYYCVGSDQVWNFNFSSKEYLLKNISKGIKISYAASIGMSSGDMVAFRDEFERYLPQFESISIREKEQLKLVNEYSGKKCELVLDPTLLLETEEYLKLVTSELLEESPYVLFFWIQHSNKIIRWLEYVNKISLKYNLKILHTVTNSREYMFINDSKCICGCGISDFLWYIKHAKFVVTNSYHATIFSMHFNIPFYIIPDDSMISRFDTLCEIFQIQDRVITKFKNVDEITNDNNISDINNIIQIERAKSLNFLRRALNE